MAKFAKSALVKGGKTFGTDLEWFWGAARCFKRGLKGSHKTVSKSSKSSSAFKAGTERCHKAAALQSLLREEPCWRPTIVFKRFSLFWKNLPTAYFSFLWFPHSTIVRQTFVFVIMIILVWIRIRARRHLSLPGRLPSLATININHQTCQHHHHHHHHRLHQYHIYASMLCNCLIEARRRRPKIKQKLKFGVKAFFDGTKNPIRPPGACFWPSHHISSHTPPQALIIFVFPANRSPWFAGKSSPGPNLRSLSRILLQTINSLNIKAILPLLLIIIIFLLRLICARLLRKRATLGKNLTFSCPPATMDYFWQRPLALPL